MSVRAGFGRWILAVATAFASAFGAPTADAGQVRVNVSTTQFTPRFVTVNCNDHVVWVWTTDLHSVTSGDTTICGGVGPFNSDIQGGAGRAFTWKTPETPGSNGYFCIPHCSGGMRGGVFYVTSPTPAAPVSNFRLSEVRFTLDHLNDFVEIVNVGTAAGNLGRYRLSLTGSEPQPLPPVDIVVPVNGRVVVWLGRAGTDTQTEIFLPAVTLPRTGSAGLYAPTTVPAQSGLGRDDLLIDFVQWGAAAQQNELTAATAERWLSGEFVDSPADGHAIAFCGTLDQIGAAGWSGIEVPNPGTADCTTAAARSTWGRLKVTYR